ncbi:MAG TPA: substrate-binding domain-containing protein [Candidatus Sulfomarinibacteraceae bacterium]|nr:substrate-binding domain-containing protein [Candidatus Sulfomarinibacteraceae bacterium]
MTRDRQTSLAGRLTLLALVLLLLLATACRAEPPGAGATSGGEASAATTAETALSVSGAFALFPLMTVWVEAYHALHPEVTFDVQAGGAGKGMTDMLSGVADIAMLSREPRQEELDQGAFLVPVTIDSVLATVNSDNPYLDLLLAQGLTAEETQGIWITQEITTWGQLLGNGSDEPINVYTRSDSSGAAEMWALFALAEAQEELHGTAVNGDPGVAEAVRQDPLAIGYNNVGFAYDQTTGQPIPGLHPVPLDLDGDGQIADDEAFYATRDTFTAAVAAGRYPFPPARVLYLVTRGQPSPAIVDFYRWVLNEGQSFVAGAGYVSLADAHLQEALDLLGE